MKHRCTLPEPVDPYALFPRGLEHLATLRRRRTPHARGWLDPLGPEGTAAYLQMSMNACERVQTLGEIAGGTHVTNTYDGPLPGSQTLHCRSGRLALQSGGEMSKVTTGPLYARTMLDIDEVQMRPVSRRSGKLRLGPMTTDRRIMGFGVELVQADHVGEPLNVSTAALSPYDYWYYDEYNYRLFQRTGNDQYLPPKTFAALQRLVGLLDTLSDIESQLDSQY